MNPIRVGVSVHGNLVRVAPHHDLVFRPHYWLLAVGVHLSSVLRIGHVLLSSVLRVRRVLSFSERVVVNLVLVNVVFSGLLGGLGKLTHVRAVRHPRVLLLLEQVLLLGGK